MTEKNSGSPYRHGGPDGAVAGDAEERAWTQVFAAFIAANQHDARLGSDVVRRMRAQEAAENADLAMHEWRVRWAEDEDDDG